MMFVVEDKVPFTNLKEALAEFPKWKMIFSQGAESHFELPARRVGSTNNHFSVKKGENNLYFHFRENLNLSNIGMKLKPISHYINSNL